MKRVSTTRAKQLREYAKLKREYLKVCCFCWGCAKWLAPDQRELHHRFGRVGRLLTWVRGFTCVCAKCHSLVHTMPEDAPSHLKCPKGCWNDYARAVAWASKGNL